MTEKELRKLNRKQLLELLLQQTEYTDTLQEQLHQTQKELENRLLQEKEAGSLAEASLKLNGVFEAAQAAADQYLENIQHIQNNHELHQKQVDSLYLRKAKEMIAEVKARCAEYEKECTARAEQIVAKAEERAQKREQDAGRILAEAKELYNYLLEKKQKLEKK